MASKDHPQELLATRSSYQTEGDGELDGVSIEEEAVDLEVRRQKERVRKSSQDVKSQKSLQIGDTTEEEVLIPRRCEHQDAENETSSSVDDRSDRGKDQVLKTIEEIVSNKYDERDLTKEELGDLKFLRDLFCFVGTPNDYCGFFKDGGICYVSKEQYQAFGKTFVVPEPAVVDKTTGIASLSEGSITSQFGTCYGRFSRELRSFGFYYLPKTATPVYCHPDFTRINPDLHKMVLQKKPPPAKKPSAAKKGTGSKKGKLPLANEETSSEIAAGAERPLLELQGTGSKKGKLPLANEETSSDIAAGSERPLRELLLAEIETLNQEVRKAEESIESLKSRLKSLEELVKKIP